MSDTVRVSFHVDAETRKEMDRLKQLKFYDKPYSELYRYLFKQGIEKVMSKEN